MSKYCLVVNGSSYFRPFQHLGLELISNLNILDENPESVGLVVFTGGEDVSPYLYGHSNVASYTNGLRDSEEVEVFNKALGHQIPMAGICRGAQFLCVMAGGHLVQDITDHGRHHHLQYIDDEGCRRVSIEKVTSTHHQMQYPWPIGEDQFEILAWSHMPHSRYYLYHGIKVPSTVAPDRFTMEPDVVYYKNIRALGIQYHPEWMSDDSWGFKYAQKMISEQLGHLVEDRVGVTA